MLKGRLNPDTQMSSLSSLDYIGSWKAEINDTFRELDAALKIQNLTVQRAELERLFSNIPRFGGWKVRYPTLLEKAYEIALDEVIASVRYVPLHSSSAGMWDWEIRWGRNHVCEPAWTADHAIAQVEKAVAFFKRDIWNEAMDEVAS